MAHWRTVLRIVDLSEEAPGVGYPFDLAVVRALPLELEEPISILVGENGSGKSTLIEAIAVAAGFNPEGGSGQIQFETHATHSELSSHLDLGWRGRLRPGWFLRAETFYNVASYRDEATGGDLESYHRMSHGESFLTVARDWFQEARLFILDEPEAALSFQGQLALIASIVDGAKAGAQFILATHSPLLMSIPGADVFELTPEGLTRRAYDDLEVVKYWRSYLDDPSRFLRHLVSE